MEIRLTPIAYYPAGACIACGERLEPTTEVAALYDEQHELGLICARCHESDPERLRARIQRHAVGLRRQAAQLEHMLAREAVGV